MLLNVWNRERWGMGGAAGEGMASRSLAACILGNR